MLAGFCEKNKTRQLDNASAKYVPAKYTMKEGCASHPRNDLMDADPYKFSLYFSHSLKVLDLYLGTTRSTDSVPLRPEF